MSIYKIIECDICGKKEKMDNLYRKPWYAETFAGIYCSKECFCKAMRMKKAEDKLRRKK